jgi:LysM repeat protein
MAKHRKRRTARTVLLGVTLLAGAAGGIVASGGSPRLSASVSVSQSPGVHHAAPMVKPPQKPSQPIVSLVNYTVAPGDSLWSIAAGHCASGMKWESLARFNHVTPPYTLTAGEVITLSC